MKKIPQFLPFVGEEEYKEIGDCFRDNWITEGPKSKKFQELVCEYLNVKHALFVSNGTVSLYIALKAMGVGPGDEVIVPDFTFVASGNAVEMLGAVPIFCEVNRRNFQIDVSKAHKLITPKTKAIMPVPMYGMACNYDEVMSFAKQYKLGVMEDAAQAFGVKYKGKHAGTFGDVGSYSFYADKTITTGEGGLLVTDNTELYTKMVSIVNHGRLQAGSFVHPENGYNFRMTDIQLAIGLVQFRKLDTIISNKQRVLATYMKHLSGVKQVSFIEVEPGSDIIPFRVAILAERAHELMKYMDDNAVAARTFFYPMHMQPCFQRYADYPHPAAQLTDANYPNAVYAYEHGVCLPTYAALTDSEIEYICSTIKNFYEKGQ